MSRLLVFIPIIAFLTVFVSCSGDADDNGLATYDHGCTLNPPDWILGSWEFYASPSNKWHFYEDYIEDQDGAVFENICGTFKLRYSTVENAELEEYMKTENVYVWRIIANDPVTGNRLERYSTLVRLSDTQIGHCYDKYPCDRYFKYDKL